MTEAGRAEKLAAARRMLKEFQDKNKEPNVTPLTAVNDSIYSNGSNHPSDRSSPALSLTKSREEPEPVQIIESVSQNISEPDINLRTIQMLVNEKSLLQKELASLQEENKTYKAKNEEFSVRVKALRSQIAKMELEMNEASETRQQHNLILKKLEVNLQDARNQTETHKKNLADAQSEINILKNRLNLLCSDNEQLRKEMDDKKNQLSLAEIRLTQLGNGEFSSTKEFADNKYLSEELHKSKEEILRLEKEKFESMTQYKEYIDGLNIQLKQATDQKEELSKEIFSKQQREVELVRQLGDLEKQMTQERQTGPSLSRLNEQMNSKIITLEQKLSANEIKFLESETKCKDLTEKLENALQKLSEAEEYMERVEVPDAKLLQAAMESDRVAASRAIEQNTLLKKELTEFKEEMSQTIIKLNNEKLELTENLEHTNYLLKQSQLKLEKHSGKEVELSDSVSQTNTVFYSNNTSQTDFDDLGIKMNYENITPESLHLLEEKLKRTMNQVAGLQEEKQHLEHLVTQLQGETETICEYVTLYQNQRGLLEQRTIERDRQIAAVSREQDELRNKIMKINSLLPQDTNINGSINPETTSYIKSLLDEIECSSLIQTPVESIPPNFHPCLYCSGKLITV